MERKDRKMSKYRIKVELAPGGNPEFAPDKELLDGVDCEGFLLVTRGCERSRSIIHNLSILEMAQTLANLMCDLKSGSEIQQALAIAEGLKKAREIDMAAKKDSMLRRILEK